MATVKRGEAGTAGARRIVRRETKKALQELPPHRPLRGEAVHDARKRLKKARAALRLMRDALAKDEYRRENERLRDAARPLSAMRDADVLLTTLDGLMRKSDPVERRVLHIMRGRLMADRRAVQRRFRAEHALATARELVETARRRARRWPSRRGWSVLGPGLARVYRAGRASHAAARTEASNENLHECRKQTKYLWHQLQFLERVRPGRMRRLQNRAHALSDRLGDDHDLAVLRDKLEAARAALPDGAVRRIAPIIEARRKRLQREAFALAERLYDEPPARFAARLGAGWHTWRD